MATINYVTLQLPEILWEFTDLITSTPHFEVRRYKHKKGIIFRLPNAAKPGQTHHAFIEHEINLSNTLRTGTLTMKVQVTFVPCHMGVFSGFERLEGEYACDWDDDGYQGDERFIPDYDNGVKNIVPLPPNIKTNLYEYLNEILFNYIDDAEMLSRYAVDLGCQARTLSKNFVPTPILSSDSPKAVQAHHKTIDFFNQITNNEVKLLPEN